MWHGSVVGHRTRKKTEWVQCFWLCTTWNFNEIKLLKKKKMGGINMLMPFLISVGDFGVVLLYVQPHAASCFYSPRTHCIIMCHWKARIKLPFIYSFSGVILPVMMHLNLGTASVLYCSHVRSLIWMTAITCISRFRFIWFVGLQWT